MGETARPLTVDEARAAKPLFGQACNGCGLCCLIEPCILAREFLHVTKGPCPALEWEDGRSWCGLVRRPSYHLALSAGLGAGTTPVVDELLGPQIREALGVGYGCDAWEPAVDGPL